MRLLLVANPASQRDLGAALAGDFDIAMAEDLPRALELCEQQHIDAALAHYDLGESVVLDLICELRRRAPERVPGIVVLARDAERRSIVELVRTGAYDVLFEGAVHPRELAHTLRNAAYYARSAASLSRRREARSKEVLVVGEGEGADSILALLEAAGFSVRRVSGVPQSHAKVPPRAIVVDLATVRDREALVRLLATS